MEPLIYLGVGKMEIDWGRYNSISDHSVLFKTEDIKQVPYYYANDIDAEDPSECVIVEFKEGLSRSLSSMKKRLELLGYTLSSVESMYNDMVREAELHSIKVALPFEFFSTLLKEIDIAKINTPSRSYESADNGYDFGEFARECIIAEEEINIRLNTIEVKDWFSFNRDLECFFENIDPYIILRLLAENPSCCDLEVFWAYADVIEEGWLTEDVIGSPLPEGKKMLIVTEGSTDSYILQKAIGELYPDIDDFFSFIDMKDNYPFTGTGSLYNFCCGLSKIGVLNNVIVIFDNDCAGTETYERLRTIPKQSNLLILKLPNRPEFESFDTVGPQGYSRDNINGSAVSIECFLDFASVDFPPIVRWTSYFEKLNKYQGALQRKDDYTRAFLRSDQITENYDTSKIKILIDYIIDQWCNRSQ